MPAVTAFGVYILKEIVIWGCQVFRRGSFLRRFLVEMLAGWQRLRSSRQFLLRLKAIFSMFGVQPRYGFDNAFGHCKGGNTFRRTLVLSACRGNGSLEKDEESHIFALTLVAYPHLHFSSLIN